MSKKRITNRKVTLRFINRNPDDSPELLKSIEEAFKPKEIEILLESLGTTPPAEESIPNELFETECRAGVERTLQAQAEDNTEISVDPQLEEETKQSIYGWLTKHIFGGWRLVKCVVEVYEKAKDLLGL